MKIEPSTWEKKSANNLLTQHNCFCVEKQKVECSYIVILAPTIVPRL